MYPPVATAYQGPNQSPKLQLTRSIRECQRGCSGGRRRVFWKCKVWIVRRCQGRFPTGPTLYTNVRLPIHANSKLHHIRLMRLHQRTTTRSVYPQRQRRPSTHALTKCNTRRADKDRVTHTTFPQAIFRLVTQRKNCQGWCRALTIPYQRSHFRLLRKLNKGELLRPNSFKGHRTSNKG